MDELLKKKVPELKQALKERGLPISGTKPELVKRLFEALGGTASDDPEADDGLQEIDDDDILNEEPAPINPETKQTGATASTTKVSAPTGSAAANGAAKATKQPPVLAPQPTSDGDNAKAAKPSEVSKLSEAERLKRRAERFGTVSVQAKKELRAQRFGLPSSGSNSLSSSSPADVNVLKKRAERFGVVVSTSLSKVDEAEKKRKRAERFGSTETVATTKSNGSNLSEDEIKKKKRAERFNAAS